MTLSIIHWQSVDVCPSHQTMTRQPCQLVVSHIHKCRSSEVSRCTIFRRNVQGTCHGSVLHVKGAKSPLWDPGWNAARSWMRLPVTLHSHSVCTNVDDEHHHCKSDRLSPTEWASEPSLVRPVFARLHHRSACHRTRETYWLRHKVIVRLFQHRQRCIFDPDDGSSHERLCPRHVSMSSATVACTSCTHLLFYVDFHNPFAVVRVHGPSNMLHVCFVLAFF